MNAVASRTAALTLWLVALAGAGTGAHAQPTAPDASDTARGEYLARIGGCASCHTEPRHGKAFAGGRAVPSPFGVIYSTNITPDVEHGIGKYSFEDFRRVMREGTAPGDRHLYPAMPYASYAKAHEDDLRDLFAYLRRGVQAVPADPPPTRLPFPLDQRALLRFWKLVFLPRGAYEDKAGQSADWNRGAYLVQSFGHCGACHTPRGLAYQEKGYDESASRFLTGQVNDLWFALDLTGDPGAGLGRVPAPALASLIATGHGGGFVASGTMVQEIEESLQYLNEDDVRAVARYLKSLPAQRGEGRYEARAETPRPRAQGNHTGDVETIGAAVYRSFCAQCHQADGGGVAGAFPRLAGNPSLLGEDASSLIRLALEGGRSAATRQGPPPQSMPSFAATLTDVQIAQVLTFTRESWGNDAKPVTTDDVAKVRKALHR
ncbi:MAG: cytochrome c [Variovorax sp.]|nr:cytochrome c [Variovorax sp.]